MKEKIGIFIIGLLVGAVLATGAFYIYTKVNSSNNTTITQEGEIPKGNPPEMNGETPPEMPKEEEKERNEETSSDEQSNESSNESNKSSETSRKNHSKKTTSDSTDNN